MLIRIDDFPHGDLALHNQLRSQPGYDHRDHLWQFLQAFERRGVPYVLGVSPELINNHSDLFFLRGLQHCEVALHGFNHGWHRFAARWQRITETWPLGGEFAFATPAELRASMQRALHKLADFKLRKFIAPFNVYTQPLLDVLNEYGFEQLLGGEAGRQHGMHKLDHGSLQLDLCLPPLYNDAHKILPHLPQAIANGSTITLHWIYEQPAHAAHWDEIARQVAAARLLPAAQPAPPALPVALRSAQRATQTSPAATAAVLKHTAAPAEGSSIAMVTETLNFTSGGVRCIAETLNELTRRGYDTACYVTHPDLNCDWLQLEFPVRPLSQLPDFRGVLISPYSPTAELVANSNATGKFYWVHSYEPRFPALTGRPDSWRAMSEQSYRLPQLQYFATSSYVQQILELIYGRDVLAPLVPGGVDTQRFVPGAKSASLPRVMFLSREHAFRGSADIVRALQLARSMGANFEVLVMGQPLDMGGLQHQLLPPLPQAEYAALLGSADIFVHASHFEGLPLPPLEAMAAGCAVIATHPGASDYLLDGHNALVVPPQRPDKIAAALVELHRSSALRAELAANGRATVTRSYTWAHTTDRIEQALAEGMARLGLPFGRALPQTAAAMPAAAPTGAQPARPPLVSALVSVYNAERFMRGLLDDLEAQTIADRLEIIVIDAGSQQNERAIVAEYQQLYDNIVYLRAPGPCSVYAAWNLGIAAAHGQFLTNANADDRHRADAFERMAGALAQRADIALVYADVLITERENETFENNSAVNAANWEDFDAARLRQDCFVGPQPMWRRALHARYGSFDEQLQVAGDWEFWLRCAPPEVFLHLNEVLGLYLRSPQSRENRDRPLARHEAQQVRTRHISQPALIEA